MLLPINQYGDRVLREVCAPVTDTTGLETLAQDMLETMYAAHGIGLAAPQIGRSIRMVVINVCPPDDEDAAEDGEELCTVNGEERPVRSIMPLMRAAPERVASSTPLFRV